MLSFSYKRLLLEIFSIFAVSVASAASNDITIYDILPRYGLPSGLLPDNVASFSLSENGHFQVQLTGPCSIQFEYLVSYNQTITGDVHYGSIENLKGIQVRRFWIWFDVETIKVDLPPGDYIYFKVGVITKKLLVDQFKAVHLCSGNRLWSPSLGRARDAVASVVQLNHGFPEDDELHANDLGSIVVVEEVAVDITIVDKQVPFAGPNSIVGREIVVHAEPYDLGKGDSKLSQTS